MFWPYMKPFLFWLCMVLAQVERTSALVFLEEHGKSLVWDEERLRKVYFVLENILGSPVDGQGMTYSLKSQAPRSAWVYQKDQPAPRTVTSALMIV